MKLGAYLINGITPVYAASGYQSKDLEGNKPYLMAISLPIIYEDITSIRGWHQFGHTIHKDYKFIRRQIKTLAQSIGWVNLTQQERRIAVEHFVVPKARRDQFYTTEEQIKIGLLWHKRSVKARQKRFGYASMQIWNRLTKLEARTVVNQIEADALPDKYVQFGTEGTLEGDPEGLFDYIESRVGTSYEGVGLLETGYTPSGMTLPQLIIKLMDILDGGNY